MSFALARAAHGREHERDHDEHVPPRTTTKAAHAAHRTNNLPPRALTDDDDNPVDALHDDPCDAPPFTPMPFPPMPFTPMPFRLGPLGMPAFATEAAHRTITNTAAIFFMLFMLCMLTSRADLARGTTTQPLCQHAAARADAPFLIPRQG
jgi:hypothetical protein